MHLHRARPRLTKCADIATASSMTRRVGKSCHTAIVTLRKSDTPLVATSLPGARIVCGLLSLAASVACSPISPVNRNEAAEQSDSNAPSTPDTGVRAATADAAISDRTSVQRQAACTQPEARRCSDGSATEVLVCRDGEWQAAEPCADNERCVTGQDGNGQCLHEIADCANRDPGVEFCDADAKRRVCVDATKSEERACGDLQRCITRDERAICGCVPGAVDFGSGCEKATSCAAKNGGCDPLTECASTTSGRLCTACPDGYSGDGERGCAPLLLSLQPSCGELEPELSEGVFDYRLHAPFVCQSIHFAATFPANSRVLVSDATLTAETSWELTPVKLGETTLPLRVVSEFDVISKYNVTIERIGGQTAYIKANNTDSLDFFGFNLAASGSALVAGAPYEDSESSGDPTSNGASNSGAAYVFESQQDSWIQQAYIKAESVQSGEFFGTGVALDGNTLAVGAPNADPLEYPDPSGTRSGAVYIFQRQNSTWVQQARLTPSSGNSADMFGLKVALQGQTLVVGAPHDSVGGAAYVFTRTGDAWTEQQKLQPSTPSAGGLFGFSVALDGDRVVVGAPHDSTRASQAGAAYVFVREAASWREQQRLEAVPAMAEMTYGWLVGIRNTTAVVTEAAVRLLRDTPPGKAHIYDLSADTWTETDTLTALYPTHSDLFGSGLSLTDSVMVIGANGDSSSARGAGADASRTDGFQVGAAYMYARSGANKWVLTTYLKADNAENNDGFAQAVAVTDDAVFVAAPNESSDSRKINAGQENNRASKSGAVYVYR